MLSRSEVIVRLHPGMSPYVDIVGLWSYVDILDCCRTATMTARVAIKSLNDRSTGHMTAVVVVYGLIRAYLNNFRPLRH